MKYEIEILPPAMPNFLTLKSGTGKRQDGIKPAHTVPVEELTREQAEQYAELMRVSFLEHWENKTGFNR